jgi:hypothetical protein
MSLIWLGKPTGKDYGATLRQQCERCHNDVFYHLVQTQRWLSINFIPILPFSRRYRLECPVCAHGRELVGAEIETQKRAALLTAAHAYAAKEEGDMLAPVPPSLTPVRQSLAPVTPESQSQAEMAANDAGGQKLMLKLVAGVVAAIVIFIAVMVVMSTPPNASSTAPFQLASPVTPSTAAQTAPPRTPVHGNARRSKRTESRAAASSAALPHADGER